MTGKAPGGGTDPRIHPSERACTECGAPLDVLQAARGLLCGAPECARRSFVRADIERQRRERRQADADLARARILATELMRDGALPRHPRYAAFAVPQNPRRLAPPDPDRVAAFEAHLDALLADIDPASVAPAPKGAAPEHGEADPPEPAAALSATPPRLEENACATCRGQCCAGGGTHAFLRDETLRRWFARHPGADREACRAAYLGRIGGSTYEDSCVFHGEAGCALERDLRSDSCNAYRCRALSDIRRLHEAAPAPVGVLVAFDGGRPTRVRLVDAARDADPGEIELPP